MSTRLPSTQALRAFEAAARLGSFKAAAQELSVTPTAISHQIRTLESQLGIALFTRHTRAVVLTDSGRRLAETVHRAFQQIMLELEDISATKTTLTVSTTPAFAALWLVPRLGRFQERHSEWQIQLATTTAPVDLEQDRNVDMAIRYGAGSYPQFHATPLADETFGAFATPDYLRRMEGLQDARLIETAWQESGLEHLSWETWLSAAGLNRDSHQSPLRFDQEHHVVQAGLASQGLVLASSLLVSDFVQRGWLEAYRPELRMPGRRYTALCLPGNASLRKLSYFLEWLMKEAAGVA